MGMKFKDSIRIFFCGMLLVSACDDQSVKSKPKRKIEMIAINKTQESLIKLGIQNLKDGDIVLRTGNDVISNLFAQLNKTDKTYSHCGIAFYENHSWVVYHSIGGEDNPDEKLRREPFKNFVHPQHNLGFGICRYILPKKQLDTLHKIVHTFYAAQIPFDMKFDLQSNDRLYCAEMIYKAFNKATQQTNFFTTTIHQGFEYVSTDNIFVNNKAEILCHLVY